MLLHAHQHAFTPFPHQPCASGIPAAPVGTQDCNDRVFSRYLLPHAAGPHTPSQRNDQTIVRFCHGFPQSHTEVLRVKSPPCGNLKSHPFDPSLPCHSDMSKTVELDQLQHPLWKEKLDEEKHRSQQINKTKDLPLKDKSLDQTVTAGRLANSTVRRRQLDCDSFLDVKRAKKEEVKDHFESSHRKPNPHVSDLHPSSNRCTVTQASSGFISHPGAELHPYQTMWDLNKSMALYCSQNIPKGYTPKTHKVITIPPVPHRPFYAYSTTPLYFPHQDTLFHREREFLHSQQQLCHFQRCRYQLTHPGFLQTPHFGH
ncbi:uncharacterized protein LOC117825779 [Xyrichtys novacula]|uniref:Uncharacterized protein LOC117825779 n=1 Tax=Xyrichtys novacula TaxID=13765 RepID=A0AAV1FWC1_XYRNO|nr:uncharacterized protein LOC117825779 [Xyrichtys novacula]